MKIKLFLITLISFLLVSPGASAADERYRGDGHMMVTPDQLVWGPVASMGEGAEIAFIAPGIYKTS